MSKIEKINRYIELTGVKYEPHTEYQMRTQEIIELYALARKDPANAIRLAFDYGRAKGERHARKELKKA